MRVRSSAATATAGERNGAPAGLSSLLSSMGASIVNVEDVERNVELQATTSVTSGVSTTASRPMVDALIARVCASLKDAEAIGGGATVALGATGASDVVPSAVERLQLKLRVLQVLAANLPSEPCAGGEPEDWLSGGVADRMGQELLTLEGYSRRASAPPPSDGTLPTDVGGSSSLAPAPAPASPPLPARSGRSQYSVAVVSAKSGSTVVGTGKAGRAAVPSASTPSVADVAVRPPTSRAGSTGRSANDSDDDDGRDDVAVTASDEDFDEFDEAGDVDVDVDVDVGEGSAASQAPEASTRCVVRCVPNVPRSTWLLPSFDDCVRGRVCCPWVCSGNKEAIARTKHVADDGNDESYNRLPSCSTVLLASRVSG